MDKTGLGNLEELNEWRNALLVSRDCIQLLGSYLLPPVLSV